MVSLALLAALVVVLQTVASNIKVGPIPITLTLVPIVIGAIVFGPAAGAFLGAIFGVIALSGGISGTDWFTAALWNFSPFWTAMTCLVKGALCGAVSGWVYRALQKHVTLGCVVSALVCPVVNTGVFALSMLTVMRGGLMKIAADNAWGSNVLTVLFVVVIGVNFFVELGVNAVLSAAIARIVKAVAKSE